MTVRFYRLDRKYHCGYGTMRVVTFPQLQVFVAVAETGGFTAAAARLGISQPAASRAVAQLERELGAPLLVRTRDGVAVTEAGRRALTHARETLRHARLVGEEVAATRDDVRGPLTVASFPTATAQLLPPLLRRFGELHPHVEVRLLEGTDQEVRSWLDGGAADVAMVVLPARGINAQPLAEDELVAVVATGHPLATRATLSLPELAADPFILSSGGCGPLITDAARRARARLAVAYEVRDVATILTMVEAELGVSVVPTLSLYGTSQRVTAIGLNPRVPRALGLAVLTGGSPSPATRAFLTVARETARV